MKKDASKGAKKIFREIVKDARMQDKTVGKVAAKIRKANVSGGITGVPDRGNRGGERRGRVRR